MGLEVFDLDHQQSQDRAMEVSTRDDIAAIEPCADLSIRVADHKADIGLIDALQSWLDAYGGHLETLSIDARWIFVDRLVALDLRSCGALLGVSASSIHLSPTVFGLSQLEYLRVRRSLLPIDGSLVVGGSSLPNLVTCDFDDTSTGASEVLVANADRLRLFGFSVDQDYGDGSDPIRYRIGDCKDLISVGIGLSADLHVEVFGELPALEDVRINPGERSYVFEHGSCGRHPVEEVVDVYDDDRGEYTVSIIDYDGTGFPYDYRYRF